MTDTDYKTLITKCQTLDDFFVVVWLLNHDGLPTEEERETIKNEIDSRVDAIFSNENIKRYFIYESETKQTNDTGNIDKIPNENTQER